MIPADACRSMLCQLFCHDNLLHLCNIHSSFVYLWLDRYLMNCLDQVWSKQIHGNHQWWALPRALTTDNLIIKSSEVPSFFPSVLWDHVTWFIVQLKHHILAVAIHHTWAIQWQYIWVFPKIGVPQNGWFTIENPIKMDDLGVPLFLETPICVLEILHTI